MSASTADKYAFLVEKLYEMTVSGEAVWRDEDLSGRFSTAIGSRKIEIFSIATRDGGEPDIIVRIVDFIGTVLDTFSDVDLVDAKTRVPGFYSYYSLMSDLLRRAARKASGAEDVLDSVLRDLGAESANVPVRNLKADDDEIPF